MSKRYRCLLLILCLLAGLWFFQDALIWIFNSAIKREDSSHGIFVPLLFVWFIRLNWEKLKQLNLKTSYFGGAVALTALMVPFFKIEPLQVQSVAFIFYIAGLVILLMGYEFFRVTAFPIIFLITMVPIPENIYLRIADLCREIAFNSSLIVISIFKIPYFRDGCNLFLPNANLHVAHSCSGIRYLISYLVFGMAYAYITKSTFKARLAVILVSLPISLMASTLRLSIIFCMTYFVAPWFATYWPHVIISWFVFFSILIVALCIDRRRFSSPRKQFLIAE